MAGTALLGRLTWRLAELVEVVVETPRVKTIVFDVPSWPGHQAGQQRLPLIHSRISSRVFACPSSSSAMPDMICPGVQ